jgi:predicted TIM-barrel fold metal-dependent hydrolase
MPAYTRTHEIEPHLTDEDIEAVLGLNAARMLRLPAGE